MWASAIGGHMDQVRYYYDSIMSPFKPKILDAMERIKGLPMRLIAPGHGPILDEDLWSYVDAYQRWSSDEAEGEKRIVIAYASAYGHTRRMAEGILEGYNRCPRSPRFLVDVSEMTDEEMDTLLTDIDGLIVGSPTFNADAVAPIWRLLSHINPIKHKGILAGAFGNYGWSGEAVELLEKKMHSAKLALVQPGDADQLCPNGRGVGCSQRMGQGLCQGYGEGTYSEELDVLGRRRGTSGLTND